MKRLSALVIIILLKFHVANREEWLRNKQRSQFCKSFEWSRLNLVFTSGTSSVQTRGRYSRKENRQRLKCEYVILTYFSVKNYYSCDVWVNTQTSSREQLYQSVNGNLILYNITSTCTLVT